MGVNRHACVGERVRYKVCVCVFDRVCVCVFDRERVCACVCERE